MAIKPDINPNTDTFKVLVDTTNAILSTIGDRAVISSWEAALLIDLSEFENIETEGYKANWEVTTGGFGGGARYHKTGVIDPPSAGTGDAILWYDALGNEYKLSDDQRLTPMSFGAIGDNVADDTAAINLIEGSAYDWIYLPEGHTYLTTINGPLTKVYFGPGCIDLNGTDFCPNYFQPDNSLVAKTMYMNGSLVLTEAGGGGGGGGSARGALYGFNYQTDGGDPDHDITIGTGLTQDVNTLEEIELTSAITKKLDATWGSGNNGGGRASAVSLTADTWYALFVIKHANGTVDAGFDTDINAANLLSTSGYTHQRRIGWVYADASSNIKPFFQDGNNFIWDKIVNERGDVDTTTSFTNEKVTAPPLSIARLAVLADDASGDTVAKYGIITDTRANPDLPPDRFNSNMYSLQYATAWNDSTMSIHDIRVDENSEVKMATNSPALRVVINTLGWEDTRGAPIIGSSESGILSLQNLDIFDSGPQTIPANGNDLVVPHEFGEVPLFVTAELLCEITSNGYTAGERVQVQSFSLTPNGSNSTGLIVSFDGTNIVAHVDADGIEIPDGTTNQTSFNVTSPNWKLVLKAFKQSDASFINNDNMFVSDPVTPASSSNYTFAHNLEGVPDLVFAYLECIDANNGYNVGDIVEVPSAVSDSDGAQLTERGVLVTADQNNVYVRTSAVHLTNPTNGESFDAWAVLSKFNLYVKAFRRLASLPAYTTGTVIDEGSFSAVTNLDLDFGDVLNGPYEHYSVELYDLEVSNDGVELNMQGFFDGTLDTGANYATAMYGSLASAGLQDSSGYNETSWVISNEDGNFLDNQSDSRYIGEFTFKNIKTVGTQRFVRAEVSYMHDGAAAGNFKYLEGFLKSKNTTNDVLDGVRVSPSAGTITGKYRVIGHAYRNVTGNDIFVSTEQSISHPIDITLAHNLAGTPINITYDFVCKVAEGGYSVGDVVSVGPGYTLWDGTSTDYRLITIADSTTIRLKNTNTNFSLPRFDNTNHFVITPANWRIVFKASVASSRNVSSGNSSFDSGTFPYAQSTSTTFTHNLGATPVSVELLAVCKVANNGYAVGDEVAIHTGDSSPGSGLRNHAIAVANDTEVKVRIDNYDVVLGALDSDTHFSINATNWDLRVRALANNVRTTNPDQDKSEDGYRVLDGGVILQWGKLPASAAINVTFPKVFPNACFNVQVSWGAEVSSAFSDGLGAKNLSTTGFDVTGGVISTDRFWTAIGH